ncbi:hypothetical protein FHG87_002565 [Trinorchestia longiramus]|nr:hypothetical protein FHG87_002565 [Trinorchestia longiramus]
MAFLNLAPNHKRNSFSHSKTRLNEAWPRCRVRSLATSLLSILLAGCLLLVVAAQAPERSLETNFGDVQVAERSHRAARSAFSPPTVTSVEPHRRGISSIMNDPTLPVGRQSEGPYHPSYMRKAPYRQQSSHLISDEENLSRPHTMYFEPETIMNAQVEPEDSLMYGPHPQAEEYKAGSPLVYGSHNMDSEDKLENFVGDRRTTLQVADLLRSSEGNTEDARSRQRRVENPELNIGRAARHGRFGEGGSREDAGGGKRFDTFGQSISEELWTGPKRSLSPVHPSARAARPRDRGSPQSASGGRSVPPRHGFRTSNAVVETHEDSPSGRGNKLLHPGSRMMSRGSTTRNGHNQPMETITVQDQMQGHANNPRMFRPRTQIISSGSAPSTLSLTDVMERTNLSFEQLTRKLEDVGLSLPHLLQIMNNGETMNDVLRILQLFPSDAYTPSTGMPPTVRTANPYIREQAPRDNKDFHRTGEATNSNSRLREHQEFSDPVYSEGVHPINRIPSDVYGSDFITESGEIVNMSEYDPHASYEDYYSQDPDGEYETKVHAQIHTFPEPESSTEADTNAPKNKFILDEPTDPHPNYNQWDQMSDYNYNAHDKFYGEYVEADSSEPLLRMQEPRLHDHNTGRSPTQKKKPLTYAVIAASAIMGSLAVFTFFVLIAYAIVKCTRKPTLNNYQVSDKKPVEVTAAT